jgi:hypothetical protein
MAGAARPEPAEFERQLSPRRDLPTSSIIGDPAEGRSRDRLRPDLRRRASGSLVRWTLVRQPNGHPMIVSAMPRFGAVPAPNPSRVRAHDDPEHRHDHDRRIDETKCPVSKQMCPA